MSNELRYYKFEKPLDASNDWEANLMCLCKKHKINITTDKIAKGRYMYSLSCPKDSFDILVREMRKRESKTDEP